MGSVQFSTGRIEPTIRKYAEISKLHNDLSGHDSSEVEIDFSLIDRADAQLVSALRVVVDHSFERKQHLRFTSIAKNVSDILPKNGFFKDRMPDTNDTTIPWRHFSVDDRVEFASFAREHLSRHNMPRMSKSLSRKVFEGIDEIFASSSLHSKSPTPISVCGQYYPRKSWHL